MSQLNVDYDDITAAGTALETAADGLKNITPSDDVSGMSGAMPGGYAPQFATSVAADLDKYVSDVKQALIDLAGLLTETVVNLQGVDDIALVDLDAVNELMGRFQ